MSSPKCKTLSCLPAAVSSIGPRGAPKIKMLYDWVKNKVYCMFLFLTSRESGMPFLDLRLYLSRVPAWTRGWTSLRQNPVCMAIKFALQANISRRELEFATLARALFSVPAVESAVGSASGLHRTHRRLPADQFGLRSRLNSELITEHRHLRIAGKIHSR